MNIDTEKIEELMQEKGVDSIETLLEKIQAEAAENAKKPLEEEKEGLVKQIKDLETIKSHQGDEVGNLRKDLTAAIEKLESLGEKKVNNANPASDEKSEADWAKKNEARLAALSDEELAKLNDTIQKNSELKQFTSTEAGKAVLMDKILGAVGEEAQEIFRRPQKQEKLTIAEQIEAAMNKQKPNSNAAVRPAGSGFDPNRTINKKPQLTTDSMRGLPLADRVKLFEENR